jgi:hypothetical protein
MSKQRFFLSLILSALVIAAWASVSAAQSSNVDRARPLPSVLRIGDSICGGYEKGVKRLLAGKAGYRPIVQIIDNFARNHKLGLIFETRVGKGKLLVCAIDLLQLQDHPETRQLYHSLLHYVTSDAFAPEAAVNEELLKKLLP